MRFFGLASYQNHQKNKKKMWGKQIIKNCLDYGHLGKPWTIALPSLTISEKNILLYIDGRTFRNRTKFKCDVVKITLRTPIAVSFETSRHGDGNGNGTPFKQDGSCCVIVISSVYELDCKFFVLCSTFK